MRTGFRLFIAAVAISVLLHLAALLGVGLSGRPTPLEAPPQEAVTVDIVSPEKVSPELKPSLADLAAGRLSAPPPAQTRTPRQVPPPPAPPPPASERSPFDPATLADIFRVSPVATTQAMPAADAAASGFDAAAGQVTGLPRVDVAAFRAHLRKCLTLPAGVTPADNLRVVFRIGLKRDGALSTPPTLVEASASPNGPAMARSVMQALRQCQPYGFLPAEKYDEWKLLDLSVTPRDMAGE
ncbi:MAG: hypothetical protein ABSG76_05370 [Xanthobacteraceae bacterium]|jgi:hypothetical protein